MKLILIYHLSSLQYQDLSQKRSPHLVPYDQVDNRIKDANRESAAETIRALQLFGIYIEPPAVERDEGLCLSNETCSKSILIQLPKKNLLLCDVEREPIEPKHHMRLTVANGTSNWKC